jgi:hypothetical protein
VRFWDRSVLDRRIEIEGFAGIFTDGSARVFGFQSESRPANETNYADDEKTVNLLGSYHLGKGFRVAFGERFRRVAIEQGAINSLPFIRDRYSPRNVPGVDGFTAHGQRVGIIFDSLDSRTLPTSGF